jgi:hypothetical protein
MASTTKARGYSPRGVPPVLEAPATHSVRCNCIAAVDNKGELFFQTFDGTMDAARFKAFILALVEDAGMPVSLIVDNLKVHHATCLKEWFSEMGKEKQFRIHYLPSYAPELQSRGIPEPQRQGRRRGTNIAGKQGSGDSANHGHPPTPP